MTVQENIRYLLRRSPKLKFKRSELAWEYFTTFLDVSFGITKTDWIEKIYPKWQSIDRAFREVIKEPEFSLKPEDDAQRYAKSAQFKETYKRS